MAWKGFDPGSNSKEGPNVSTLKVPAWAFLFGPVAQLGRALEKMLNNPVKLLPTERNQVVEGSNPSRPAYGAVSSA